MFRLSESDFEVLAGLMRLRVKSSSTSKALKMMLVDGTSLEDAATLQKLQREHVRRVHASAHEYLKRVKALQSAVVAL